MEQSFREDGVKIGKSSRPVDGLRSAETFSEEDIISATQRQLTWTHLKKSNVYQRAS